MFSRMFGARSSVPTLSVVDAQGRIEAGAVVVDVREPFEYAEGHVPGAQLVPLGSLPRRVGEIPRDREVLMICRSGNRSGTATRYLLQQGFTNVANVSGGMIAWVRAGFPIE